MPFSLIGFIFLRVLRITLPLQISLNHLKPSQCFCNRHLFLRRTLRLLYILGFWLIVAFPLDNPVLLLDLRNVQRGHR